APSRTPPLFPSTTLFRSGGTAASAHLDTTEPDQHEAVIAQVEERFGRLDIAANNAGVTVPATPTAELPIEQWQKVRNVDLDGVLDRKSTRLNSSHVKSSY